MSRPTASLGADYFEDIFQGDADPWGLNSRTYEIRKRQTTIAALGDRRFERALEVGCAGGAVTEVLAPLCNALLAVDISQTALDRARTRLADCPQVRFERAAFPTDRPSIKDPDLIVLSEVAYYWSRADLAEAARYIEAHLVVDGLLLMTHWLGQTDYPQTGDGAIEALSEGLQGVVKVELSHREAEYRLDLWRRL